MCKPRTYTQEVKQEVHKLLIQEQWSPQQISGYFKRIGKVTVSHETIYADIRWDKICGGTLWKYCRHKLKHRKKTLNKTLPILNRISIDQRPPEVDGKRFGDWEMDTIVGPNNKGAIVTLVEKSRNYLLMGKLPYGKNAKELAKIVINLLLPYKSHIRTITTDNGCEFAAHIEISKKLETQIFFAHPYSSWEKGAIENMNKLIRQYIPKHADLKAFSEEQIKQIQYKINRRPRRKLDFSTPKVEFFKHLS
jgi:transposase, IS30 family